MFSAKKITTYSIKLLIGVFSFYIIYQRFVQNPQLADEATRWLTNSTVYYTLFIVLLLMPVNWGIESYKWKLATQQIEIIDYTTSLKCVFSGICLGNIAPGRAIEFLGKIFFFKPENRPTITVLHFMNGMFQMLVTVFVGIISVGYKITVSNNSAPYLMYIVLASCFGLLVFFVWAIANVSYVQKRLNFFKWFKDVENTRSIVFNKQLASILIFLSVLRYLVFTTQFYLVYSVMLPDNNFFETITSIAAYFMITSSVPMISVIEPAIRAAIALFVFNNGTENTVVVVLSSTTLWIVNVVAPSVIGYIVILKEKIEIKTLRNN